MADVYGMSPSGVSRIDNSNFKTTDKAENSCNYNDEDRPSKNLRATKIRRIEQTSSDDSFYSSDESWNKLQPHRPPEPPETVRELDVSKRSRNANTERSKRKKHIQIEQDYRSSTEKLGSDEIPYLSDEGRKKERLRRKYSSPENDKKAQRIEKFSYYADEVREKGRVRCEKERLRRKYNSPDIKKTKKTERVPYFADEVREKDRLKREKEYLRRKYSSPDIIKKIQKSEKVPYFKDEIRERDRLRRKYGLPSPPLERKRYGHSRSRSSRRRYTRSRSRNSRSRSRSRHRRSSSERYRSATPKIITIPVPVPDYSFAFPPFASQNGWPRMPIPPHTPTMMPYYSRHRYRNPHFIPSSRAGPPPPPIAGYMPHLNVNGIPNFGPTPPLRWPDISSRFRISYS